MQNREIHEIPLTKIAPNPYQPRRFFDQTGLDELAGSIKMYGVLQPISVRLIGGSNFELVAGERRLRASRMAGLATIPAILVEISDLDSAVIAIIENLQRQNLHFLEEAEGFANLISDYAFTQEALAERVGKNQSTIANKLRLLRLPRAIQKYVIENDLSERHARALLRLEDEQLQLEVLEKIVGENLNVRKAERLVDELVEAKKPKQLTLSGKTVPFTAYIRDIRILTNTIQENLDIVRKAGMETRFDMQQTDTGYSIFIQLEYAKPAEAAGIKNLHGHMSRRAA